MIADKQETQEGQDHMPGRPIARKDVKLKPLPLRLSTTQFERLVGLRARDGMAIQEHVRRAVDMYLDAQDKKAQRSASPAEILASHPAGSLELPTTRIVPADARDLPPADKAAPIPVEPQRASKRNARPSGQLRYGMR
jgi:hypothetical protein